MGTIKTGFYNLKFIITPFEFSDIINNLECYFIDTNNIPTKNSNIDKSQVVGNYTLFYELVMSGKRFEPKEDNKLLKRWTICAKIIENWQDKPLKLGEKYREIQPDGGPGIMLNNFQMGYYRDNKVSLGNILTYPQGYLGFNLWYQKGVAKLCDDGKHFEFIDSKNYISYPLFEKFVENIKFITKPLRFLAPEEKEFSNTTYKEIKTPIRISEKAAENLSENWLFKTYQFQILTFKKSSRQ